MRISARLMLRLLSVSWWASAALGFPQGEPVGLIPGTPLTVTLASGEVRRCTVALEAGSCARVVVRPRTNTFRVQLSGPDGRTPTARFTNREEDTVISIPASQGGRYLLEFAAESPCGAGSAGEVLLARVAQATAGDAKRVQVEERLAGAYASPGRPSARDLPRIIRTLEEGLRSYVNLGERLEASRLAREIAALYDQTRNSTRALEFGHRALQLCGEEAEALECRASSLNTLARLLIAADPAQASAYGKEAYQAAQRSGSERQQVRALNNMGEVAYDAGDTDQAMAQFQKALLLQQTDPDSAGEGTLLLNLGYCHEEMNRVGEAFEEYQRALALFRADCDLRGEARARAAMLHHYAVSGQYYRALEAHAELQRILPEVDDPMVEAPALNTMGFLYRLMGDYRRALQFLGDALIGYEKLAYRSAAATVRLELGRTYSALGDYGSAEADLKKALAVFEALGDIKFQGWTLRELGALRSAMGDPAGAMASCGRSTLLAQKAGDLRGEAYSLRAIGAVHERAGDHAAARENYEKALSIHQKLQDSYNEALAQFALGKVARSEGDLGECVSRSDAAMQVMESLRSRLPSMDMRASYQAAVAQNFELLIDTLMQLHRQAPSEGWAARAFHASERARARTLLDLLGETWTEISKGVDPLLLRQEREIRAALGGMTERRIRLLNQKPQSEEAEATEKEIGRLETAYDQLLSQVRIRSPRYAALTQPRLLLAGEVQQALLNADTRLLEFALGEQRSWLWVISPDGIKGYELPPRSSIEQMTVRVLALLRQGESWLPAETGKQRRQRLQRAEDEFWAVADELGNALLGPASADLKAKCLLLVPDGILQYVPFAALPTPLPRLQADSVRPPGPPELLLLRHEITVLPSASVLAMLREQATGSREFSGDVAVFADPVFDLEDAATRKQAGAEAALPFDPGSQAVGRRKDAPQFGRLPATRREAEAILSAVPAGGAVVSSGFAANRSAVLAAELHHYRVVHFATHGFVDDDHPQLSCIALSMVDERGRSLDGYLRLLDIYNLELPVELVVLSACNTALGKNVRGEGIVGFVRGFMYAGARRVLASLWKVDDDSTARLMEALYRGMFQGGLSPAAALRQAQLQLWRTEQRSSPYYWAGFILQGDYR